MTEKEHTKTIELDPQPQKVEHEEKNCSLKLGLVGNYADTDETRFLLTPEGSGLLTSSNVKILMEKGAATDISFPDSRLILCFLIFPFMQKTSKK